MSYGVVTLGQRSGFKVAGLYTVETSIALSAWVPVPVWLCEVINDRLACPSGASPRVSRQHAT